MPERWREALDRLGRVEPDVGTLRSAAGRGPRTPDRGPERRRGFQAGIVALVAAVASFALVVSVFRRSGELPLTDELPSTGSGTPTVPTTAAAPDPLDTASICTVPSFDPDVALLVGSESVEYPITVLEGPGQLASSLEGAATDALRHYLASPAARHAPEEGWRAIATSAEAVTFAAPHDPASKLWWVVGFEDRAGEWTRVQEEIVEQQPTPAQRGRGVELRWDGEVVLEDGAWTSPLRLVNTRSSAWVDDRGEYVAAVHTFDPATGEEVGPGARAFSGARRSYDLAPGAGAAVPLALGANVPALRPGTYAAVACVPELGLASPVGSLRVVNDASVNEVHVLSYEPTGASMGALAFGSLTVHNGCLAIDAGELSIYVLWPQGYGLVERDGRTVLIDPIGNEVAAMGGQVSLGGGYAPLHTIEQATIGGIPDGCRDEGYFITSGGT